MCMCVRVCVYVSAEGCRVHKRVLVPLELELKVVINNLTPGRAAWAVVSSCQT